MLIGICGKAGAGKDTIGDYLVEEYGFKRIALADPIKRLVKDVFVLDDHTVYDRVAREEPLEQWDNWSVRKLLQFIGTELFRQNIDPEIWVKSLWYRVSQDINSNYVVTDIRFPNELKFFIDNAKEQFTSIKVSRDGHDGGVGLSGHESEKYDLETHIVVENNGSIEDLHEKIDCIMKNMDYDFECEDSNKTVWIACPPPEDPVFLSSLWTDMPETIYTGETTVSIVDCEVESE